MKKWLNLCNTLSQCCYYIHLSIFLYNFSVATSIFRSENIAQEVHYLLDGNKIILILFLFLFFQFKNKLPVLSGSEIEIIEPVFAKLGNNCKLRCAVFFNQFQN